MAPQGISMYEMAEKTAQNSTESASALKNIAVSYGNLVLLEDRFASARKANWKNALGTIHKPCGQQFD